MFCTRRFGVSAEATGAFGKVCSVMDESFRNCSTGDGKPGDSGICTKTPPVVVPHFAMMFGSIAASYVQSKGLTFGLFFDPTTMSPRLGNPGMRRAAEILMRLHHAGQFALSEVAGGKGGASTKNSAAGGGKPWEAAGDEVVELSCLNGRSLSSPTRRHLLCLNNNLHVSEVC